MKRALMLAVAFAGLFAFTTEAKAAEPEKSQVSQSVLASLGLGGMKAMSEKEGMQVRGKFTTAILGGENSQVIAFNAGTAGVLANIQTDTLLTVVPAKSATGLIAAGAGAGNGQ